MQRIRLHVGVGDVFQLVGVIGACIAVAHLAGLWWGVLLGAVYLIIDANLTYGHKSFAIPLPMRRDTQMLKATVQRPFVRARMQAGIAWRKARA